MRYTWVERKFTPLMGRHQSQSSKANGTVAYGHVSVKDAWMDRRIEQYHLY